MNAQQIASNNNVIPINNKYEVGERWGYIAVVYIVDGYNEDYTMTMTMT